MNHALPGGLCLLTAVIVPSLGAQNVSSTRLPDRPGRGAVRVPPPPSPFATAVVLFEQGAGQGIFEVENVLGAPRGSGLGAGSLDVLSLGRGGSVVLGFDVTLTDGPGADFTVFENGFESGAGVFSEATFVEVSTDGTHWAGFASRYVGPVGPIPPNVTLPYGTFAGLVAGLPVLSNELLNDTDALDPVVSGGEAFDLADLAGDPEVVLGNVDLSRIHFVRLTDIVEGVEVDDQGTVIWDNGAPGSADIDALAVLQHVGNQDPSGPFLDLFVDGSGHLNLVYGDPDGHADIGVPSAAFDLAPLPFADVERAFFETVSDDGFVRHLVSPVPIEGSGWKGVLTLSVRDGHAARAGDSVVLQD